MLLAQGYFDKVGNPTLKIAVSGVFPNGKQEIEAIIDTGFTGFLSMPLVQAFPIGLPLFGTTTLTLADGSNCNRLTALGTVSVDLQSARGVIILEENSTEALIGMDFLRSFKLAMMITKDTIILLDEEALASVQKTAEGQRSPDVQPAQATPSQGDDGSQPPQVAPAQPAPSPKLGRLRN